jgi:hypothetical protein
LTITAKIEQNQADDNHSYNDPHEYLTRDPTIALPSVSIGICGLNNHFVIFAAVIAIRLDGSACNHIIMQIY